MELTLDPFVIKTRCELETDKPGNRLNDAKVDPQGRVWFGSMHDAEKENSGGFYRLDPDFSVHQVDRGYICANGPTFSPDGAIVYHTDSNAREIYRFDVRPDGSLAGKRVFARFAEEEGYPDGMTTDREGCLWVAHWGGSRITRFRPDGTRDRVNSLPGVAGHLLRLRRRPAGPDVRDLRPDRPQRRAACQGAAGGRLVRGRPRRDRAADAAIRRISRPRVPRHCSSRSAEMSAVGTRRRT